MVVDPSGLSAFSRCVVKQMAQGLVKGCAKQGVINSCCRGEILALVSGCIVADSEDSELSFSGCIWAGAKAGALKGCAKACANAVPGAIVSAIVYCAVAPSWNQIFPPGDPETWQQILADFNSWITTGSPNPFGPSPILPGNIRRGKTPNNYFLH
jgi:hypothetical protein